MTWCRCISHRRGGFAPPTVRPVERCSEVPEQHAQLRREVDGILLQVDVVEGLCSNRFQRERVALFALQGGSVDRKSAPVGGGDFRPRRVQLAFALLDLGDVAGRPDQPARPPVGTAQCDAVLAHPAPRAVDRPVAVLALHPRRFTLEMVDQRALVNGQVVGMDARRPFVPLDLVVARGPSPSMICSAGA